MKVLLIAGHGDGDSGAVGYNLKEADCVREFVVLLYHALKKEKIEVTQYPKSKNCYKESKKGKVPLYSKYDYVLEIHFNAFNSTAKGTEILVHHKSKPKELQLEQNIMKQFDKLGFTIRGVRYRSNLLNMNNAQKAKTKYSLLEICFIDNFEDMQLYQKHKEILAKNISKCFT